MASCEMVEGISQCSANTDQEMLVTQARY